jgi:predicted nuclease with TOPRIM domain
LQERWRDVHQSNERLRKEIEDLRQDRERLKQEKDRLRQEQERLRRENDRLKRQLEEAQPANKRQAAPFSRRQRKENPKKPGRKGGSGYGQRYSKAIPDKVDEVIAVPAPRQCECGGELEVERFECQYQQEIVRKTIWRRFDIPICRCQKVR